MRNFFSIIILIIVLLNISCNNTRIKVIDNISNNVVSKSISIDTVVDEHNNKFKVINLNKLNLQFVEDTIPSDTNIVFCVAAAFSKNASYSKFSEKEIANDYVVNGILKHGYNCPIAKTGIFSSYNNKLVIEPNKELVKRDVTYSNENYKDSAIINNGSYFTQSLLIHLGDIYPEATKLFHKSAYANFRCLAIDKNDNILFIESLGCYYDEFLCWLLLNKSYDIVNAIYLDSGGWCYGFYRNDSIRNINTGHPMLIEQNNYQTNYLIGKLNL